MQLARHSTVTLTIDRDSHVNLEATAEVLTKIALLPVSDPAGESRRGAQRVADCANTCSDLTNDHEQKTPETGVGSTPGRMAEVLGLQRLYDDCGGLSRHGLAEGQGFEPWAGTSPAPVFKTGALNHSATLPDVPSLARAKMLAYRDFWLPSQVARPKA